VTSALAALRHHLRQARGSELGGHGVLHNDPVYDAAFRYSIHSLFPLENEQESRLHHVPALLCIRGSVTNVRIQIFEMSSVIEPYIGCVPIIIV
ncbi:hypothetical protein WA026_018275, partial [Henosepilachna vigintioctopunctata]